MALVLDNNSHINSGSASQLSQTLTTTNSNVIVVVSLLGNGGPFLTPTDTAGLTWNFIGSNGIGSNIEGAYWAFSAAALSGDVITGKQTSSSFLTVDMFAIAGANTVSPIDSGSPVLGHPDPLSISTTASNTMVIGCYRPGTASPTQGAGFTLISGANFQLCEYKIVSTPQSNLSVTIGTGVGTANGGLAFAIAAAVGPTSLGILGYAESEY